MTKNTVDKKIKCSQSRSKKTLIVGLMFIMSLFLINVVSAFEFDNTYEYNPTTKTAYIHNCDFWLFTCFSQGEVLAEATLTWGDTKVPKGLDTHVGTFLYTPKSNAASIQDLDLINLKNDKVMTRGKQYKVKVYKNISVDEYEEVCDGSEDPIDLSCRYEETGSHIELQSEWKPLSNPLINLQVGETYEIGIFVDVEKGDKGDWLPTFAGVQVKEWATWEEDGLINLSAYYKLDAATGAVNDSQGNFSGTNFNTARGVAGKINDSFDFEKGDASNYFTTTDINDLTRQVGGAISLWINPETIDSGAIQFVASSDGASSDVQIGTGSSLGVCSGTQNIYAKVVGTYFCGQIAIGSWDHVVVTWDGSTAYMYVNGSLTESEAITSTEFDGGDLRFGALNSGSSWYDGKLDEIAIYDRYLNITEVQSLYNSDDGITWNFGGTPADASPTVILNYPTNNSETSATEINFNCTATDINITSVEFYLDGSLNETNSSGVSGDYIFTKTLTDGNYNYTCNATDNSSQSTMAEEFIFEINTTIIGTITLSGIDEHIVYQRDNSTHGNIGINGTYTGNPSSIKASLGNQAYQVIDASPTGGSFSGVLTAGVGNGTLNVQFGAASYINDSIENIGVGDVYVIAGQSNAEGIAQSLNSYTGSVLATMYREDNAFAVLDDPTDSTETTGSAWPDLANRIMNESVAVPVMFITTAVGGTSISTWCDGCSNYNAMISQIDEATYSSNKVKTMLFFQGETDIQSAMSYSTYLGHLNTMANGFIDDTEIAESIIVGQVNRLNGGQTRAAADDIRRAQRDGWENNENISKGLITHDIKIWYDGAHFSSDAEMGEFSRRFFYSVNRTIYNDGTLQPTLEYTSYDSTTNKLTLHLNKAVSRFAVWNETTNHTTFKGLRIHKGTTTLDDNMTLATVLGDNIVITLDASIDRTWDITFGSGVDNYGEVTPRDSLNQPLEPFYNESIYIASAAGNNVGVELNSPLDNADIPTGNTIFNATSTTAGDYLLTNMSLYTNSTGTWQLNETTSFSTSDLDYKAYYKLDNNDFSDELGEYNLTNGGTSNTSGILIDGRDFESTESDFINVTDVNNLFNISEGAISIWVKPESIDASLKFILNSESGSSDLALGVATGLGVCTGSENVYIKVSNTYVCGEIATGSWYNVVATWDGTNVSLYVNGALSETEGYTATDFDGGQFYIGSSDIADRYFDGVMDELGFYNSSLTQSQITNIYNSGDGLSFGNSASSESTQTWTKTLTSGIIWNVEACNENDECSFAETNFSLVQDTTSPNVSITAPTGILGSGKIGDNETLNFTATDALSLDTCWYNYNNINTTVSCSSGVPRVLNFTLVDQVNITVFANDTSGNIFSAFSSWSYAFLEGNSTFEKDIYETSSQEFLTTINTLETVLNINAVMNYNGTRIFGESSCTSGVCTATVEGDIPLVLNGESQNNTWFWELTGYTADANFAFNTTNKYQNVNRVHLEKCNGTYVNNTLTFTAFDEATLASIDPFEFQGDFEIWLGEGVIRRQANFSETSISTMELCILPVEENFKTAAVIEYDEVSGTNYTRRNYFMNHNIINSTNQDIGLGLLDADDSTSFILKVRDPALLAVKDVLVYSQRFYPGLNEFRTVQVSKTDENGQTVGFFHTEVVDYRFILEVNGTVVLTTGIQKIIGEEIPFTLTFTIGVDDFSSWEVFEPQEDLTFTNDYNKTSEIYTFTYEDTSGDFDLAELIIYKRIPSTGNILACEENITQSTASLTCNMSTNSSGVYTAVGWITRDGDRVQIFQEGFNRETITDVTGDLGLFLGWLVILIAAFAFRFNEIAGIFMVNIAVIGVNAIGLIAFGPVFITALLAISIIIGVLLER